MSDANSYTIAKVELDTKGVFWVTYLGDIPEQGGITYGTGRIGFHSLKDAVNFLEHTITKHVKEYQELIRVKDHG